MAVKPEQPLTEQEIEHRRDEAIRRALNTPPKPVKQLIGKKKPLRKANRAKRKDA